MIECPGCRLKHPNQNREPPDRTNASGECTADLSDLMCYTVAKQTTLSSSTSMRVDTYAAQHAGGTTREYHGRISFNRVVPRAGEGIYRQGGADCPHEHREDKKELAPAGTSPAARQSLPSWMCSRRRLMQRKMQ